MTTEPLERCSVAGCRRPVALKHIDKLLCWYHWEKLCQKQDKQEERARQAQTRKGRE